MPKSSRVTLLGLVLLALIAGAAVSEDIQGQRTLPVIADTFQFIPGSWAVYDFYDINKDAHSKIYFSIDKLETKHRDKKEIPCFWMEVEIKTPNEPTVATRVLAEETKTGPGELFGVTVQIEGHKPFKVPAKYYKGKDSKVSEFQPIKTESKAEKKTITWKDKTLTAYEVEATDENGKKTKAVVSEEVPPLAIISIKSSEMEMTLEDWGMDAKSKIKGSPMSFYLWLFLETGKGIIGQ